jgi:hypothetical protein
MVATITITDTSHGAVTNDFVTFSGAASLGGLCYCCCIKSRISNTLVTG